MEALRQALMARGDYERLPPGNRIWDSSQAKQFLLGCAISIGAMVLVAGSIASSIAVNIDDPGFCSQTNVSQPMTLPTVLPREAQIFIRFEVVAALICTLTGVLFLIGGICIAYTAPRRHPLLELFEINGCCFPKRGGVHVLAIVNMLHVASFLFLAICLGSQILTVDSECSLPLFVSYECYCWGMALLFGLTAFFLYRKAAVVMDAGEHYGSRTVGMELLEADVLETEQRIAHGFKSWMGPPEEIADDDEDDKQQLFSSQGLDDIWDEEAAHYVEAPSR